MNDYSFGDSVVVSAEAVRVASQPAEGDKAGFRQSMASADAGRYVVHDLTDQAGVWPGAPIDIEWESAPPGFELTPDPNAEVYVRLRRILYRLPEIGIVIGSSHRTEGRVINTGPHSKFEERQLVGPGRTVVLLEVALPPKRRGRIALVHPYDAQPYQIKSRSA